MTDDWVATRSAFLAWLDSEIYFGFKRAADDAVRRPGVRVEAIEPSARLLGRGLRIVDGGDEFAYVLLLNPNEGAQRGIVHKRRHVPDPTFAYPEASDAPGPKVYRGGSIKYDDEVRFVDLNPDEAASHFSKIMRDDVTVDVQAAHCTFRDAPRVR